MAGGWRRWLAESGGDRAQWQDLANATLK